MERHNGIEPDPEGAFVYYADAQATVEALQAQLVTLKRHAGLDCGDQSCLYALEHSGMRTNGGCRCSPKRMKDDLERSRKAVEALQAEKLMLERGVSAQSALIDGLQSQLIQYTADLEALQRERDEANSHVKFLGATKQANGSFCLDMKKYHAGHRCGRHRDDPWQGIDTEIDCFVCLKQALDAEREKAAQQGRYAVDLFDEIQRMKKAWREERTGFESDLVKAQTELSQLQALVSGMKSIIPHQHCRTCNQYADELRNYDIWGKRTLDATPTERGHE